MTKHSQGLQLHHSSHNQSKVLYETNAVHHNELWHMDAQGILYLQVLVLALVLHQRYGIQAVQDHYLFYMVQ